MSVRTAIIDDLPAILAIQRAVPEAPHWSEGTYRDLLAPADESRQTHRIFVCELHGTLAGFSVALAVDGGEAGGWGEIENLAVIPAQRRAGVARSLCAAMLAWLREAGAAEITLEVRRSNAAAAGLYRSIGFVVEGTRRCYYRSPPEDALLMRLAFPAETPIAAL
jgi:ribosomal-protein-alanine N-acetyltransferase